MPQHYPEVERFITSRLPDLAGKRVLDVGCGRGGIGWVLRNHRGGDQAYIVGIDMHDSYLSFARRFSIYDDLICGAIEHTDLGPFDVVLACELLAHIPRPAADGVLERIESLALERVIIVTPNGPDLRGPIGGIEPEARVSVWRTRDFRKRGYEVRGLGCRIHRWHRARPFTLAAWYAMTPVAVRTPSIGSTLVAVKVS